MYIFPLISTAVSLVFAVMLGRQYAAKRKPYQLAWAGAMAMYGLASLAEAVGQMYGWNDPLVKTYYVFGAVMVVGYLALGTLYIQDPKVVRWLVLIGGLLAMPAVFFSSFFSDTAGSTEKLIAIGLFEVVLVELMVLAWVARDKFASIWLGHLVVGTVVGVVMTVLAKVNASELAKLAANSEVPYDAIDKSLLLRNTVISINTIGGLILILGAVYSGYTLLRKNIMRETAIGTTLIGLGAVFPYSAGYLEGYFGAADQALKSIFLTIGIIIMFFGFLQTGRGKPPAKKEASPTEKVEAPA